jgi:exodeoxyribonuclease VII large subunit
VATLFDPPFEEPDSDDLVPAPEPVRRHVFTVAEITARLRVLLEQRFADVWVEGEISNCRVWNTGHLYFTLKDAGAQIRGMMFRSAVRMLRFTPHDGLRVIVRGRVSVYDPKGEYQIVCEQMEPEGLGALQLAFDQLKRRLGAEGLFDEKRKRPLPALPRKIGVVTSLDGAAIHDVINVLRRRHPNAHVVIRPTRVQGEGAGTEIARAIRAIARVPGVDVLIVGRGGGSAEDLRAFNEEVVARAVAACPVATISAVGHESDVTICDFVADVRAPTPSAAAEMVVARKEDFLLRIDRLTHRGRTAASARIHRAEARLRMLEARPGYAGMRGRIALRGRHAGEITHELRRAAQACVAAGARRHQILRRALDAVDLRRQLAAIRGRLVAADARGASASARMAHRAEARLGSAAARLHALSPLGVLARGYAMCWNEDRTAIVRDAAAVTPGQHVRVTLGRGELGCEVRSTHIPPEHDGPDNQRL